MDPTNRSATKSPAPLGFEPKLWLAADKLRNNLGAASIRAIDKQRDCGRIRKSQIANRNSKNGRPEIQDFYGALAGKHARKGIFITTSSYASDA